MNKLTDTTGETAATADTGVGAVLSFDPATDPAAVHLTAAAIRHLSKSLTQNNAKAVRLGVTESGCNGYMYELSFAASIDDADHRYQFPAKAENNPNTNLDTETGTKGENNSAVTVVVARQDLPLVQGTEIDYVTEGLNSALKFANPNADTHCGCGESFSVSAPADV